MKFNFGVSALLVAAGLLHAGMSQACPQPRADGNIDDNDVRQYVRELEYINNGYEKNKILEKCYLKKQSLLSWEQVGIVLDALYSDGTSKSYYSNYNKAPTQNRITESYLNLRITSSSAIRAVEISQKQSDGYERNRLIERYFDTNQTGLSWQSVKTLLDGLSSDGTSRSYHSDFNTQNRITEKYLNLHTSDAAPVLAVEMAQKQSDGYQRNALIERYFEANKTRLTWPNVQTLLAGLYSDGTSGSYYSNNNKSPSQDRIIRSWNECQ
jgi:hypothetical protein